MRIINRGLLDEFENRYADAREDVAAWREFVSRANWSKPDDLRRDYGGQVRVLPPDRAIFHIRGNRYRLVVQLNYGLRIVSIRFLDTHQRYDAIDATAI